MLIPEPNTTVTFVWKLNFVKLTEFSSYGTKEKVMVKSRVLNGCLPLDKSYVFFI